VATRPMTSPRGVRDVPAIAAPRYFTVVHPRLWGGEHPCPGGDARAHAARLATLLDAGVTTFVDLTEHDRENGVTPYGYRLRVVHRHVLSVAYFNFPVPDARVPQYRAEVEQVLDVIDAALENGERIYVHCRSGIGRTGTVLALHMVRHGYTPVDALRQLENAWRRDARSQAWPRCPQTEGQRRYIMEAIN
jgi:atypical dual specificity phosphatase